MPADKTSLEESIKIFDDKKRLCVSFLDELSDLKLEFDRKFNRGLPENDAEGDAGLLSLKSLRETRERIDSARLKILIAGQFKTGKSTLLNSILGSDVLPADVLPCTAVITEIEYGAKKEAALYFKSGLTERSLPENLNEEVKKHIGAAGSATPAPLPLDMSDPAILSEYITIPAGAEQKQGIKESPYAKCVLKWPLEICRNGAVIIDSPGLNENEARDATTREYLGEADIIIHILNALQLFGIPDQQFVHSINMRGDKNFPLLFAINRMDQIKNESSREKIRKHALGISALKCKYGDEGIFFTSAQEALDGRLNNDQAMIDRSGVKELERKIAEIFENDRGRIKLGQMNAVGRELDEFANVYLPDILATLNKSRKNIEKMLNDKKEEFARLEKKIERIKASVVNGLNQYERDFRMGLEGFFNYYIYSTLPKTIEDVQLNDISLFNKKKDIEEAFAALNASVAASLQENFEAWMLKKGTAIQTVALKNIYADIKDYLEEFSEEMRDLRQELSLSSPKIADRFEIDYTAFSDELMEGLIVGGIGGGAMFVLERFLPAFLGPVGWAIVVLATVGSIVGLILKSDKPQKQAKEKFREAAVDFLEKNYKKEAPIIAHSSAEFFADRIQPLYEYLNKQIESARRPLEVAMQALAEDGEKVERSKVELEDFIGRFRLAQRKCAKIVANL